MARATAVATRVISGLVSRWPNADRGWDALRAALITIRPADTGMVVAASLVGARVSGVQGWSLEVIVLLALSNGLLCGGSMAFNDWRDMRVDAVNRPRRPLVAGRIAPNAVVGLAAGLFAAGLVAALVVGPRFAVAGAGLVAASLLYSGRLKAIPFVGNVTVATVMSYPVWCWLLAGASPDAGYLAVCLAVVLFRLGAEIIKTAEDWRGDAACGLRTVATIATARGALWLGCIGLLAASVCVWIAAAIAHPGVASLIAFATGTGLAVAACIRALQAARAPEISARAIVQLVRVTTVVVAVGLVAGFG
jgi:4-hydroxybenzoate polyprenyltransferase